MLQFHGGLNSNSDPRDIVENEFTELQNVAVDRVGRLVIQGDLRGTAEFSMGSGALSADPDDIHGTRLMAITTDYTGLCSGSVDEVSRIYWIVERSLGVDIDDDAGEETKLTFKATSGFTLPVLYWTRGALRMAEGGHAEAAEPILWRGYIGAKTYMPNNTAGDIAIPEQWATTNASIAGAFPYITVAGIQYPSNAIMLNSVDSGGTAIGFNGEGSVCSINDGTTVANTAADTSPYDWGLCLFHDETANSLGSWMPTSNTRYKFYVTTMYDDHTQESLPQLFRMFGTRVTLASSPATHAGKSAEDEIYFTNGNTNTDTGVGNAEAGVNVAVNFIPVIKIGATDVNNSYNFGAVDLDGDGTSGGDDNGNPRISGVRIYWASNEDGYSSLWQMFDIKFDEGCRVIGVDGGGGDSGYAPMVVDALGATYHKPDISSDNKWSHPPRLISYEAINGHSHQDTIDVDNFKASVVVNNRTYIGNIKQDDVIHRDRMLRSPVGQYDKFPSINDINVATNDGDQIVALLEFADRILQFKKNALYIINVSGEKEYLESEHRFKGIRNPGAACRTDYGIAWTNESGCYLYDGQQIHNLLEKDGIRRIDSATWKAANAGKYEQIGYNPHKRQIVVKDGTSTPTAGGYIYDIITKSWTISTALVEDANSLSPFINHPEDGTLLIFDEGNTTIDKWRDTPTDAQAISIKTKDIDFGEPGIKKNIYTVYVSYKGDASSVTCTYQTNGDTDAGSNFYKSGETGATTGATSSTTPFHSSTVGTDDWVLAELKPAASISNVYSFQLIFGGAAATDFEINDISIIYRMKGAR